MSGFGPPCVLHGAIHLYVCRPSTCEVNQTDIVSRTVCVCVVKAAHVFSVNDM